MERSVQASPPGGIQLSAQDLEHLGKAARWAKTIAILGFVMLGFMILFGVMYGAFLSRVMGMAARTNPDMPQMTMFPTALLSVFMVLMMAICAAIYFFPLLYLYRFATHTLQALEHMELAKLTEALRYLRNHFGYVAVLMIIGVAFYGLFLLIMLGMMAFIGSDFMQNLPQA